jgi:hypothetical protein
VGLMNAPVASQNDNGTITVPREVVGFRRYRMHRRRPADGASLRSRGVDRRDPRPLDKSTWAAVNDCVSGPTLTYAPSMLDHTGVVAISGRMGSANLPSSVHPFVLRVVISGHRFRLASDRGSPRHRPQLACAPSRCHRTRPRLRVPAARVRGTADHPKRTMADGGRTMPEWQINSAVR